MRIRVTVSGHRFGTTGSFIFQATVRKTTIKATEPKSTTYRSHILSQYCTDEVQVPVRTISRYFDYTCSHAPEHLDQIAEDLASLNVLAHPERWQLSRRAGVRIEKATSAAHAFRWECLCSFCREYYFGK